MSNQTARPVESISFPGSHQDYYFNDIQHGPMIHEIDQQLFGNPVIEQPKRPNLQVRPINGHAVEALASLAMHSYGKEPAGQTTRYYGFLVQEGPFVNWAKSRLYEGEAPAGFQSIKYGTKAERDEHLRALNAAAILLA